MKFLDRLDRIVRPIAVPNLTLVIIIGQALMLLGSYADPTLVGRSVLIWNQVLAGEVWRVVSFFFIPPGSGPIFILFYFMIFYMMGSALEAHWGMVRYNVFFWMGAILTVGAAAFARDEVVTGGFLQATVFLAFATYNPDFELRLFFVLPVKVKWLAMIQAVAYLLALIGGTMSTRMMVLASVGNYLIFFAPSLYARISNLRRRAQWERRQYSPGKKARHTCAICGVNSDTDPKMDFRYCSKCNGELAYCEAHLRNHQHVESAKSSK